MAKVKLLHAVVHNSVSYEPGSTFEGDDETVAQLIEAGAARDPKAPKEEPDTSTADADDKAKAIIAEAEKEAENIREAARKEAETIKADAKAEAEKAVKASVDAAQKTPAPKSTAASK